MPVGPTSTEVDRCRDTIESIVGLEPAVRWIVLVDDDAAPRDLLSAVGAAATDVEVVRLDHPLASGVASIYERLTASVLVGLRWVVRHTPADVVMKIDTDALVIAPFADKLSRALAGPAVGLIGAYDRTCNGEERSFDAWVGLVQRAATRRRLAGGPHARRARRLVREARAAGYEWGEHVLACALAMPRVALDAIDAGGGLDDPLAFVGAELADDPMLAILVRRAGYRLAGHVGEGDTFAVAWRGLPDTPGRLVARGYSIIHSVKNDPRVPESEIRRYFAAGRARPISARSWRTNSPSLSTSRPGSQSP
ncbi:MAG TPA: hypothetical protein VG325_20395 [Solirubrobacteraceae bacterium]|nr:hypothetical protein [Solirubrobacteraceae bacterium]